MTNKITTQITTPGRKIVDMSGDGARRMKSWIPAIVVAVLVILSAPFLIGPSCPHRIVIATGSTEGAYFAFAERYREILARDGIELEIRSTAGSIENLDLLTQSDGDVTLALMQGGLATDATSSEAESLASLYMEPVWVFYRRDSIDQGRRPIERLTELSGKRIAVGAEGSGTRAIARLLLDENKKSQQVATSRPTQLLSLAGREAAGALRSGTVDAAFFVISPHAPLVRELIEADGIELMSFSRADAYRRRFPFLSSVTLSEGTIDLEKNLPRLDVELLAPTANLVARKGLHSALVPLLLKAAIEVHQDGGLLEEPGVFPSALHVDFPLNADARRYLKSGPSMFYRYLPFSVAAWLDQMKLMLLPLCTLLLPFLKAFPPLYRWRIRSKIYRWYRVLREIDQEMKQADGSVDLAADITKLTRLESELAEVSVPLSYMEEFYNLRLHVAFVLNRLKERARTGVETVREAA